MYQFKKKKSFMNVMCSFGPIFSVLELVDAAIPAEQLEPIKPTILQTEGVKVSFKYFFFLFLFSFLHGVIYTIAGKVVDTSAPCVALRVHMDFSFKKNLPLFPQLVFVT